MSGEVVYIFVYQQSSFGVHPYSRPTSTDVRAYVPCRHIARQRAAPSIWEHPSLRRILFRRRPGSGAPPPQSSLGGGRARSIFVFEVRSPSRERGRLLMDPKAGLLFPCGRVSSIALWANVLYMSISGWSALCGSYLPVDETASLAHQAKLSMASHYSGRCRTA
jgi:hypothetical protein